ncbi:DDE superfamily endonuclease domain-containing protein [Ditylenchus destructor]|nr:DDE superfamily endonuclease domain-containing protein [Ditylenchus destructor]
MIANLKSLSHIWENAEVELIENQGLYPHSPTTFLFKDRKTFNIEWLPILSRSTDSNTVLRWIRERFPESEKPQYFKIIFVIKVYAPAEVPDNYQDDDDNDDWDEFRLENNQTQEILQFRSVEEVIGKKQPIKRLNNDIDEFRLENNQTQQILQFRSVVYEEVGMYCEYDENDPSLKADNILPTIKLSRARRCIENTFGIMAAKFRILLRPIETSHEVSDAIVKAILCLHNFLIEYSPPGKRHPREMADFGLSNKHNGQWRCEIQPQATAVIRRRGDDVRGNSQEIRNKLTEYISGVGAVGWQDNYL